jgi:hypothetical protein
MTRQSENLLDSVQTSKEVLEINRTLPEGYASVLRRTALSHHQRVKEYYQTFGFFRTKYLLFPFCGLVCFDLIYYNLTRYSRL